MSRLIHVDAVTWERINFGLFSPWRTVKEVTEADPPFDLLPREQWQISVFDNQETIRRLVAGFHHEHGKVKHFKAFLFDAESSDYIATTNTAIRAVAKAIQKPKLGVRVIHEGGYE